MALSQAMGTLPSGNQHHQSHQFSLSSSSGSPSVVIQPNNNEYSFHTSPASVTVDLPSIQQNQTHHNQASEENGVLLCNLDDLSRYIPENFYSDFTLAEVSSAGHVISSVPEDLHTVVAGKAITTTVSAASHLPSIHTQPISQFHQNQQQNPQTITVHLPTQPQPIQGVKTVTYVNKSNNNPISPGKITQYAYTPSGERIAITGISPEATKPGSTVQVQVKGGGYQTLQLTAIDPNNPQKMTVVQELPEMVTIQEAKPVRSDAISSILEEMKHEEIVSVPPEAGHHGMTEYATAIPVAVTSDPKKTTIKRVAGAPTSTVFLPSTNASNGNMASNGQSKPRLIFAGNTLPQGAIPIHINGLNAIPITAVKSIPLNTVISSTAPVQDTSPQPISSPSSPARGGKTLKANKMHVTNKVTNNNGSFQKITQSQTLTNNINKAIGNNKTCNWVFENGEVCGKTFSKSYNLVVHMRMHEDVRPFGCSLCDQTFRQKAHLQRHETTHGIGVKISNRSNSGVSGGNGNSGGAGPRRKRKRSAGRSNSINQSPTNNAMSVNLQQRLARVSEQFANKDNESKDEDESHSPEPKLRRLSVRLDRCDENSSDPNAAFQPFIATPEEAAAVSEVGQQGRTPHDLDAAVTAAVNDAISDIQDTIM